MKTMTYLNNITNEDIDKLETCIFNGIIHVISDRKNIPFAINKLKEHSVVGFDTETKPSFNKGVINKLSLVQLALPNEVFLLQIHKTGFTDELKAFFENKNILKVGVSIKDDLKKLKHLRKFNPGAFLELQNYSDLFNIESNSLKKLAAIVLGVKISKSQRLSNWEADELTEAQILYAATDAWICLEIYKKLRDSQTPDIQDAGVLSF